jgi:hypothetical protein
MNCGWLDTWLTKLQDESYPVIIQKIVRKEEESARDRHPCVSVSKSTCMILHLPEESSVSNRGDNGSRDKDFCPKNSMIVRNQPDVPLIHQ